MSSSLTPTHRSDSVVLTHFAEFLDLTCASTPDVNCAVETDSQDICAGPVYEVEVEVIVELRSIEYLEWDFGNLASRL